MKWLNRLKKKLQYMYLHHPVDAQDLQSKMQAPKQKMQQYLSEQMPPDKELDKLVANMDNVASLYGIPIIYFPDGTHTFMSLGNDVQLKMKRHK